MQEANTIGTTYPRASFLPETHANAVEDLLRRYVELRIPLYDRDTSQAKLKSLKDQCAAVERELGRKRSQQGEKFRRRLRSHSLIH